MPTAKSGNRPLLPRLFDFERMFLGGQSGGTGEAADKTRNPVGFPAGSVVVLQGPPGAGKSTFALAVVRDLLDSDSSLFFHYVSIESSRAELARFYGLFGWFGDEDPLLRKGGEQWSLIVPSIHIERPVLSSEDVINEVIDGLRKSLLSRSDEQQRNIVVVDSLTALLRSCESAGEERRQAREFLYRIQQVFRKHQDATQSGTPLDLVFLLSEQHAESAQPQVEEYLADFVLALSLRRTDPHTVRRTFRVTKARGASMMLGESSWAILTSEHADRVISQEPLRQWIAGKTRKTPSGQWGTIAVFPRPQLAAIGRIADRNHKPPSAVPTLRSGVPGLDEMLNSKPEYWSRLVRAGGTHQRIAETYGNPGLVPGTATLVVGPSGTGKTTMCLQFLLEEAENALYVAFERPLSEAGRFYPGHDDEREQLAAMPNVFRRRGNLDFNTLLAELEFHLARDRFDKGRNGKTIRRVALDGLSSLLATVKREDAAWLVETLLEFVRRHTRSDDGSMGESNAGEPVTMMITSEVEPLLNQDVTRGISALADNVVTLRNLRINDQLRKAVYVEKARNLNHDRSIREFKIVNGAMRPLRIHSGLEGYTGLLTRRPQPVTVVLQLFAENRAEKKFNRWLERHLRKRFHYDVMTFGFSRDDITRTMHDAVSSAAGRLPDADIKVLSIDEWWIREHPVMRHPLLKLAALEYNPELATEDRGHTSEAGPRSGGMDGYQRGDDPRSLGTDERDFWVFEIDKTTAIRERPSIGQSEPSADADLLAVPAYTDFGLFCVNRRLYPDVLPKDPKPIGRTEWLDIVEALPRLWARPHPEDRSWFDEPRNSPPILTLVDLMHNVVEKRGIPRPHGFSFDMETREVAACMFFELAWGFGEKEGFLIDHALSCPEGEDGVDAWVERLPCAHALRFLQFLVLHDLMPARPTSRHLRDSVFSRHFYSTFQDEVEAWRRDEARGRSKVRGTRGDADRADSDRVIIAPLMPIGPRPKGQTSEDVIRESLRDAFTRLERFLRRVLSTYKSPADGGATCQDGRDKLEECRKRALNWDPSADNFEQSLQIAEVLGDEVEKWLTEHSNRLPPAISRPGHVSVDGDVGKIFIPPTRGLTETDVRELLKWHRFRIRLIAAELERVSLRSVLEDLDAKGDIIRRPLPTTRVGGDADSVKALAGYSCTGSWMVGVYWGTQSPGLSSKIVEEVVSLDSARERARRGAGIPSRKDFYEFHGHERVTGASYLTWNQILLLGDSRGRRRDRVLCPHVRASAVYQLIHEGMMLALETALARRSTYRTDNTRESALCDVKRASTRAVRKVIEGVRAEMQETPKLDDAQRPAGSWVPCSECPHTSNCEKAFRR